MQFYPGIMQQAYLQRHAALMEHKAQLAFTCECDCHLLDVVERGNLRVHLVRVWVFDAFVHWIEHGLRIR